VGEAHELMARYSSTRRVERRGRGDDVVRRRVLVDEPYVFPRMMLLDKIATGVRLPA